MDNSENIKCPMFTVWIIFVSNIFFIDSYINVRFLKRDILFIIALIIIILIDLMASIFVTISFEKNKFCFYLTGLIMASISSILMTIVIIMTRENILIIIYRIIIEWSQLIVLLIYMKNVRLSFTNSHLNDNLISEFPKETLPLRQTKEQKGTQNGEQDIYI